MPAYDFANFEGLELADTTGAGDAYTGAFAVGLLEHSNETFEDAIKEAMIMGTQAAFLTISRYGAGPAMPLRAEVEALKWS